MLNLRITLKIPIVCSVARTGQSIPFLLHPTKSNKPTGKVYISHQLEIDFVSRTTRAFA